MCGSEHPGIADGGAPTEVQGALAAPGGRAQNGLTRPFRDTRFFSPDNPSAPGATVLCRTRRRNGAYDCTQQDHAGKPSGQHPPSSPVHPMPTPALGGHTIALGAIDGRRTDAANEEPESQPAVSTPPAAKALAPCGQALVMSVRPMPARHLQSAGTPVFARRLGL